MKAPTRGWRYLHDTKDLRASKYLSGRAPTTRGARRTVFTNNASTSRPWLGSRRRYDAVICPQLARLDNPWTAPESYTTKSFGISAPATSRRNLRRAVPVSLPDSRPLSSAEPTEPIHQPYCPWACSTVDRRHQVAEGMEPAARY